MPRHPLTFPVTLILICVVMVTMWTWAIMSRTYRSGRELDTLTRIECSLHRDDPGITRQCGWVGE